MQYNGGHFCGGSIISRSYILTAGHCVLQSIKGYAIRAGSENSGTGGKLYKVKNIIKHPDYQLEPDSVPLNDIALFQVFPPFRFDKTRAKIPLFEGSIPRGVNATVSGWGRTENNRPSTNLKAVVVPTISKQECNKAYEDRISVLPEGQICAVHPEGGKDACDGDSGGPLAINGRLAGVVSWGYGCGEKDSPGVYTEVSYYLSWIRKYALV